MPFQRKKQHQRKKVKPQERHGRGPIYNKQMPSISDLCRHTELLNIKKPNSDDPEYISIVQELAEHNEDDLSLAAFIETSIVKAAAVGKEKMRPALYKALDWPLKLDDYYLYLSAFARWTPQQSGKPVYLDPYNPKEHQEAYVNLCHFYFLIDQEIPPDGKIVQLNEYFKDWLVRYANDWGSYLDTTESFNDDILNSFINYSPEYRVQDSMVNGKPNSPSGWLTFNQFFARELNPGLRPIDSPETNSVVCSPSDCTYMENFPINADGTIDEIVIKGTHSYASIQKLLEGSAYKDDFNGGHYIHYFLNTFSYHRFHAPVSGKLLECRSIPGLVYLDVKINEDGFYDAPDSAKDGYEFYQSRGLVVYDTKDSPGGDIGLVAVLPVGMAQVSSVNMTATKLSNYLKGDEFGYFLFGGSDIIVLFQKEAQINLSENTNYRYYGSPIGTATVAGSS